MSRGAGRLLLVSTSPTELKDTVYRQKRSSLCLPRWLDKWYSWLNMKRKYDVDREVRNNSDLSESSPPNAEEKYIKY